MVKILAIILSTYLIVGYSETKPLFEKEILIEFTPQIPVNETLVQNFQCNDGANIRQLTYTKNFKTKISCNDWSYKRMNTAFNMTTADGKMVELNLHNVDTTSAHVNGHLILTQKGVISGGICAGAKFEKVVFNIVDSDACDGHGVTTQKTVYASVKITSNGSHYCEAFCFGDVSVELMPGVTNIQITSN